MKRTISICLALLSLAAMPCLSKEKRFAPLRPQLLLAKTVFLAGGPPAVLDKAYEELRKWGRFQVVSDPSQADVVFEFRYGMARAPQTARVSVYDPDTGNTSYGSATVPGVWSEFLTITDSKTKEVLYEDGREGSPASGAVPVVVSAFKHPSMARDMLKDLRKRIDATECARTFEYAIQLGTRTAKFFADMGALDEKLGALDSSSATLKDKALEWRRLADDLAKANSETADYFDHATADDLLRKKNVDQIEKYRDDTLSRGCSTLENFGSIHFRDAAWPPDVAQALAAAEADEAALSADCSSEQAKNLLKTQSK
jgi:hypothetical protein